MFEGFMKQFSAHQQEILRESAEIMQDYSDFLRYFSVEVAPSLLVLGSQEDVDVEEFVTLLSEYKKIHYHVSVLSPQDVIGISGHLGDFKVKVLLDGKMSYLNFAQIVLFYEDENLQRFMGCEVVHDYGDAESLIAVLDSRVGTYRYHNVINYNSNQCQYHHRRPDNLGEGYCHRCVDVCPTFGVHKDDGLMELGFSALDCISCGACVMACPTGSVQRDGYDKESLYKIAKLYRGIVPIVMATQKISEFIDFDFKTSLPLLVVQPHLLNEVYLLSIIQESGAQVVIYDEENNLQLQNCVYFLNEIFQSIFQKDAILLVDNKQDLQTKIGQAQVQKDFYYSYPQGQRDALRHIFAERLKFFVTRTKQIFGKIEHRGNVYGRIFVDEQKCTLCMGCVGACNVQSLSAGDFALKHNPSLCTACGYCEVSCPEHAIDLDFGGIELQEQWFEYQTMAQDRGFKCVECGKIFANTKAVEKIKTMMTPIFKNDFARLKSLECCETCKVKVMFGV